MGGVQQEEQEADQQGGAEGGAVGGHFFGEPVVLFLLEQSGGVFGRAVRGTGNGWIWTVGRLWVVLWVGHWVFKVFFFYFERGKN